MTLIYALVCKPGTVALIKNIDVDGIPFTQQTCESNAAPNAASEARDEGTSLTKRNLDMCGAPCTTYCNEGAGGPNPNGQRKHI